MCKKYIKQQNNSTITLLKKGGYKCNKLSIIHSLFIITSLLFYSSCNKKRENIKFYIPPYKFTFFISEARLIDDFKKRGLFLEHDDSEGELFGGSIYRHYSVNYNVNYLVTYYFISNELNGARIEIYNEKNVKDKMIIQKVKNRIMPCFVNSTKTFKDIVSDTIGSYSDNDNRFIFFLRTVSLDKKIKEAYK